MTLASFFSWAGQFESYLVENPEDRFSRDEAHITGDILFSFPYLCFILLLVHNGCDIITAKIYSW